MNRNLEEEIFINSCGTNVMIDPLLEGSIICAIINWKIIVAFGLKRKMEKFGCLVIQMNTFNGDPEKFASAIKNPDRVHALASGEKFILPKK